MSNKLGIYFVFIILYNLALSIPFTIGASSVDREGAISPTDENKPTSINDEEIATLYINVLNEPNHTKREEAEINMLYEFSNFKFRYVVDKAKEESESTDEVVRTRSKKTLKATSTLEKEINDGFEFATKSRNYKDKIANKLRYIKEMEELDMHINHDDYDAMENAVSNIMTLDKAKKDRSNLIEEIHNSDYTMDEMHLQYLPMALKIQKFQEMVHSHEHVGAVYRLSVMLGYFKNDTERDLVKLWEILFTQGIFHELRHPEFFNDDKSLSEHYRKALTSSDKFESFQNKLAADIIVTMRKLKTFWLKEGDIKLTPDLSDLNPVANLIEQMRLLQRIEYDKVLTIQHEVIATKKLKWEKLMKCAYLQSAIYQKMGALEHNGKNISKWKILLDLFESDEEASIPKELSDEPRVYEHVQTLHYFAMTKLLCSTSSSTAEVDKENAESEMGQLLKSLHVHLPDSQRCRDKLKKLLTNGRIIHMFKKIGIEINEKYFPLQSEVTKAQKGKATVQKEHNIAAKDPREDIHSMKPGIFDDKEKTQLGKRADHEMTSASGRIATESIAKPELSPDGGVAKGKKVNDGIHQSSSANKPAIKQSEKSTSDSKTGSSKSLQVQASSSSKQKEKKKMRKKEKEMTKTDAEEISLLAQKPKPEKHDELLPVVVKNVEQMDNRKNLHELALYRYELKEREINDEILEDITSDILMADFIDDGFLYQKLRDFCKIFGFHEKERKMIEWLMVLVVGCHINEIEKRLALGMELLEKWPEYFVNDNVDLKKWKMLQEKWHKEIWKEEEVKEGEKEVTESKRKEEEERKECRLRDSKKYTKRDLDELENYLYHELRDLTSMLNGNKKMDRQHEYLPEKEKELLMSRNLVKRQLFLANLAKSLLLTEGNEIIEMKKLDINKKMQQNLRKILSIFYELDEEIKKNADASGTKEAEEIIATNLFGKFKAEFLMPWKNLLEQQRIDDQIWPTYAQSPVKSSHKLNGKWQKINFYPIEIENEIKSVEKLKNLIGFVSPSNWMEGTNGLAKKTILDSTIEKLQEIVTQKFAPKTTLQFGGAYQLGLLSKNMEIDAILIASKKLRMRTQDFFGSDGTCDPDSRRCVNDNTNSLYCILCNDQHVFNLRKRPKSHIPIMNFTYCTHFMHLKLNWEPEDLLEYQCVRFEISFVTLQQGYGTISAQTLENTQLLIKNFKMAEEDIYKINWSDKRAGMINTLAGYKMNKDILNRLTTEQMREAFRISLIALKTWAKSNHIFSGVYGFLNDASLSLMLVKIMARYPAASVPFLLEKFFLHYTIWSWPMPVQLAELGENKSNYMDKTLGWRADKEIQQKKSMFTYRVEGNFEKLTMPIIAPGVPERNVAFNVNHSTAVIIKKELENGLTEIRKHLKHDGGIPWNAFLDTNTFFHHKYDHYIVLHCLALDNDLLIEFCENYVVPQLRLQLIFTVERRNGIELCHIMPDSEKKQAIKVPEKVQEKLPEEFKNSNSKYWLIGVRMKQGYDAGYTNLQSNSSNLFKMPMNTFLNDIETGFTNSFEKAFEEFLQMDRENRMSPDEASAKVNRVYLHAEFLERTDNLADWYPLKEKWVKKEDEHEQKPAGR